MSAAIHRLRRDLSDSLAQPPDQIDLYGRIADQMVEMWKATNAIRHSRTPGECAASARHVRRLAEGVIEAADSYLPKLEDGNGKA
jgi:hypothetical protein